MQCGVGFLVSTSRTLPLHCTASHGIHVTNRTRMSRPTPPIANDVVPRYQTAPSDTRAGLVDPPLVVPGSLTGPSSKGQARGTPPRQWLRPPGDYQRQWLRPPVTTSANGFAPLVPTSANGFGPLLTTSLLSASATRASPEEPLLRSRPTRRGRLCGELSRGRQRATGLQELCPRRLSVAGRPVPARHQDWTGKTRRLQERVPQHRQQG